MCASFPSSGRGVVADGQGEDIPVSAFLSIYLIMKQFLNNVSIKPINASVIFPLLPFSKKFQAIELNCNLYTGGCSNNSVCLFLPSESEFTINALSLVHFGLPGQFKGNSQQLMFHVPCPLLQMGRYVWVCFSLLYIVFWRRV